MNKLCIIYLIAGVLVPCNALQSKSCKPIVYDLIIGGGGIAGLNTAYQILKKRPGYKILLFEKKTVLGGRIERGFVGGHPVDLGAVRIPTDFTKSIGLANELGLPLIPFTTDLQETFTREKWFSLANLNQSQQRYFLPPGTPPGQTPIDLLFETLIDLVGTLDVNNIDPNRLIQGVKLKDWNISGMLKTKLTSEQMEWISNSLNFSFYKSNWNAFEFCRHNFSNAQYYLIGPTFGNMHRYIEKLDERTPTVKKIPHMAIQSAIYDQKRKLWTICVLDTVTNVVQRFLCKKFLLAMPPFNFRSILINVPDLEVWNFLLNCTVPFPLGRIYLAYPYKWWPLNAGSAFDESTNKMVWVMAADSPVLLASYHDDMQVKFWAGLPRETVLAKAHEGVLRAFNVTDPKTVPMPLEFAQKEWEYDDYPAYFYKPGFTGAQVQALASKPFGSLPLYIATSTLSDRQAWIEGAISASGATAIRILEN